MQPVDPDVDMVAEDELDNDAEEAEKSVQYDSAESDSARSVDPVGPAVVANLAQELDEDTDDDEVEVEETEAEDDKVEPEVQYDSDEW